MTEEQNDSTKQPNEDDLKWAPPEFRPESVSPNEAPPNRPPPDREPPAKEPETRATTIGKNTP